MSDATGSFGEVLRRLRSAAALSQEGLAERSGLSRHGISDLERGARLVPRLETVRLLADALALGQSDRQALLAAARPTLLGKDEAGRPPPDPVSSPEPVTCLIGRETEAQFPLPRTRYARSGDLNIAYQVFGEGPVDLVWVPGYVSHVEHFWKLPAMAALLRRLASKSRVLLIDKRGLGMSDRPGRISTIEERIDDIRAVMDACRSERAIIAGVSVGVPLGIAFAATYPQRTRSLILYGGPAAYVQQPDYPWAAPREKKRQEIDAAAESLHQRWGTLLYAREEIQSWGAPAHQDDEELVTWFAELMRLGASPGDEIARRRVNLEVDVRHVLPAIRVPTLVLHRTGDLGFKIEEGRYLADHIPGAIFAELPGGDHFAWMGDQESLIVAIERFMAQSSLHIPPEEPDTVLATVVHVACDGMDQANLAAAASRFGERFRGRLVTTTGSGIDALFDGPARAIRFAGAVTDAARSMGADVCGGIQIGEMEIGVGGASGPPIEIARRLAEHAQPGQLLTTSIVRDLVAGSGIHFNRAPRAVRKIVGVTQVLLVDRSSLP